MAGTLPVPVVPAPAKLILLKTAEATPLQIFQRHLLAMDDVSVTALLAVFEGMLTFYMKGRPYG